MTDPIEHVVLLALENRSFDQMLGGLQKAGVAVDGVVPPHSNTGAQDSFTQKPSVVRQMKLDPGHELAHVLAQISGTNSGFIADFEKVHGAKAGRPECDAVMGYYEQGFLPALHPLARDFTICDRWFSSVPGPTWPNRFFLLSGTSMGRISMPGDDNHDFSWRDFNAQNQDTIFDRLNERGIHWKSYFHDIPQSSMLVHQRQPHNAARYFYIDEFFRDAAGRQEDFPQFCFLEPNYMGLDQNDDHPPHDIMKAERLLASVYNALRANPRLWQKTLLIVVFDEHGGFYDHVPPPRAIPPDSNAQQYTFDRLGVRVPALLVSPWVDQRVESTVFDHTSVLKYLIVKWGLRPLGERAAAANSIAVALKRTAPRPDDSCVARLELTEDQLRPPDPDFEEDATNDLSAHHHALQLLGAYLKSQLLKDIPQAIAIVMRLIEWAANGVRTLLGTKDRMTVSITRPDRLARRTVRTREHFAKFLRRTKQKAPDALARRLRVPGLSEEERDHTVRTLALITRRRFHHEQNRRDAAQNWLRKHRYKG